MFLGRFAKKWGAAREQELKDRRAAPSRTDSGVAWTRAAAKGIWKRAHEMRKDRNLDRHGHDETEQAERLRQRHLREISAWCDLKDSGALSLSAAENKSFVHHFKNTNTKKGQQDQ